MSWQPCLRNHGLGFQSCNVGKLRNFRLDNNHFPLVYAGNLAVLFPDHLVPGLSTAGLAFQRIFK